VGASKAPAGGGDPCKKNHMTRIENQVQEQGKNWPTPKALEVNESAEQWAKRRLKPSAKMMGPSLTVAVQLPIPRQEEQINTLGNRQGSPWATPTTRDYKGMYPQWSQESESKLTRSLLPDQAHSGTYKGKLNPRWVETLMGLPVGWTMPSCATPWIIEQTSSDCSEMELCPPQQSEHLESFGGRYSDKRRGDSENGD
jgi:hypothetical protein